MDFFIKPNQFILATIPECSRCEAMFRSIELYKAHRQVCCGGRVCFNDEIPTNRKLETDYLLIFPNTFSRMRLVTVLFVESKKKVDI